MKKNNEKKEISQKTTSTNVSKKNLYIHQSER